MYVIFQPGEIVMTSISVSVSPRLDDSGGDKQKDDDDDSGDDHPVTMIIPATKDKFVMDQVRVK